MEAQFQMVAVSDLIESKLNPRQDFDAAKLGELTESVRVKGVLEPLLVRPTKSGFEVAAGARRFRAARAAGLKQVPAMVREMTDAELLEVAILENVVRADISPLEEGDAYRTLVEEHGYTIEQLVEKTGKSRTVVFQRMKLAGLQGPMRELVLKGKLTASVAELLARLPTPSMQEAALKTLSDSAHYKFKGENGDLSLLPYREAKELLDEEFRLHLKSAPFDVKSVDLVPTAGACGACTKRTAAAKELFPGVREDTCLDSACWKKKEAAAFALLKAEAKEAGKTLVKVPVINDPYATSGLSSSVAKKFDKPTMKVDGEKTWRQLLGEDVPVVTLVDSNHQTMNMVDKAKALELLREKNPAAAKKLEKTPAPEEAWRLDAEKRMAKDRARRLVSVHVRVKAMPKVQRIEDAVGLLFVAMQNGWQWRDVMALMGLDEEMKPEKLKPAQRIQVLAMLACQSGNSDDRDTVVDELAKLAKLDTKKLLKAAEQAESGTCFACGATGERTKWNNEQKTLCTKCAGEP